MDRNGSFELWDEGQPASTSYTTDDVSAQGSDSLLSNLLTVAIPSAGATDYDNASTGSATESGGTGLAAAAGDSAGERLSLAMTGETFATRGGAENGQGFALASAVTARSGDAAGVTMSMSCACCGPMGSVGQLGADAPGGVDGPGTSAPPTTAGTLAQMAQFLRQGYWASVGSNFDWKWTTSNISFNVTALTAQEQTWAREAFKQVSRVANLTFTETSGAAGITFVSPDSGQPNYGSAFANFSGPANGSISSATVSISADWDTFSSTEQAYNYYYQTYLHEIGHALGLGHQGPYNGSASYPTDAEYFNDSWQASIMSYFSQSQNTYNAGLATGSFAYVSSYMQADILALQGKYGAATTTTGTWFGNGPTVDGIGFNADSPNRARSFTMYSANGVVRLDVSSSATVNTIRMDSGQFSSTYGFTDNVSQYNSTLVEYRGGSNTDNVTLATSSPEALTINTYGGNDAITGAQITANHTVDGGEGTDTYTRSLNLGSNAFLRRGASNVWTMDTGGGDATLTNVERAIFNNGSVALRDDTRTDLTADGSADVIWYNASVGALNYWDVDGGSVSSWNFAGYVNPVWTARSAGDFQGDGREDVLYRRASDGAIGFLTNNGTSWSWQGAGFVSSSWDIVAVTDTNNDGRSDIIYRNAGLGGAMGVLTMNGGSGTWSGAGFVNAAWTAAGFGDTNADGRGEVIFYNGSVGALGSYDVNGTWRSIGTSVATTWTVGGVGDFDANGTHDVLMYNASLGGALGYWKMGYDGSAAWSSFSGVGGIGSDWAVEGTGDYNNDGATDILFYNSTLAAAGILTIGSGGTTAAWTGLGPVNSAWQIV